jgi:hypothetical protein
MKTYSLPLGNGKQTTSVKKHIGSWENVYKPICDMFNCKCIGYDPDISFVCNDTNITFTLPVIIAKKISDNLIKKDCENCESLSDANCEIMDLKRSLRHLEYSSQED